MQNRIEPPILMSRILTFVFTTTMVVLVVLGVTLYKMFPLDRPQVFFLTTVPHERLDVSLNEMGALADTGNLEMYKRRFVREYIRARNEIVLDRGVMRQKWNYGNYGDNALVRMWSTPDVFKTFTETDMWGAIMSDAVPDRPFKCSVEFQNDEIDLANVAKDVYSVKFLYLCTDGVDKIQSDYVIEVKLETITPATIHWADRRGNPLGVRVSEYNIKSGNGDPLGTKHLESATKVE